MYQHNHWRLTGYRLLLKRCRLTLRGTGLHSARLMSSLAFL